MRKKTERKIIWTKYQKTKIWDEWNIRCLVLHTWMCSQWLISCHSCSQLFKQDFKRTTVQLQQNKSTPQLIYYQSQSPSKFIKTIHGLNSRTTVHCKVGGVFLCVCFSAVFLSKCLGTNDSVMKVKPKFSQENLFLKVDFMLNLPIPAVQWTYSRSSWGLFGEKTSLYFLSNGLFY